LTEYVKHYSNKNGLKNVVKSGVYKLIGIIPVYF